VAWRGSCSCSVATAAYTAAVHPARLVYRTTVVADFFIGTFLNHAGYCLPRERTGMMLRHRRASTQTVGSNRPRTSTTLLRRNRCSNESSPNGKLASSERASSLVLARSSLIAQVKCLLCSTRSAPQVQRARPAAAFNWVRSKCNCNFKPPDYFGRGRRGDE
jgi:hypothetical protein